MTRRSSIAAIALAIATLGFAGAASAANTAIATANVNMRAGPSTSYPVVRIVPAGANVASYGCVADYSWCDVGYGGARGWVSASYLTTVVRGATVVVSPTVGFPVVTYAPTTYWNRYYTAYPWYARGPAYYRPAPRAYRAPAPYYGCRNGCSGSRTVTGPRGNSASRSWSFHR
ncbi:SH3 domain-containing protein [Amorphus sp. 3PC139-8]|uniref:SH3 domain-containing protein n=1 Tax=Amorphus sp. 3PC139-8 TaxID=2735676 RepID=UPI00345D61A5